MRATLDRLDREERERTAPLCSEPRCPLPAIPLRHSPWPNGGFPRLLCQMHLEHALIPTPTLRHSKGWEPCIRCGLKHPPGPLLCGVCVSEVTILSGE